MIENFWTITWDLREGESYAAQVLPYPSVNLSITNSESDVTGLVRRRYVRQLDGAGYAVGARFRPGCFRPFAGFAVSRLTDRHQPIEDVLGRSTASLRTAVEATADRNARVALLAEFLVTDRPELDDLALLLADLVTEIAGNRGITRVAQVAALAGLSIRSVQRAFAEYVGAGPKWVVQRCRLQDAAARAATAERIDWAGLATELGFADQAHLTRAFTATIGTSPAAYARQANG